MSTENKEGGIVDCECEQEVGDNLGEDFQEQLASLMWCGES